jgi:hypothetical protein
MSIQSFLIRSVTAIMLVAGMATAAAAGPLDTAGAAVTASPPLSPQVPAGASAPAPLPLTSPLNGVSSAPQIENPQPAAAAASPSR